MPLFFICFLIFFDFSQAFYAKLGDILEYEYETNLPNTTYSLQATIKLYCIWENIDLSHYQTSISRLYAIKIVKFDTNEEFNAKFESIHQPFYIHSYDHQISPIILSLSEDNFSVQIKKAIASIFQLTGHNMTERDIYHDCLSIYDHSGKKILKKRICKHPAFSDASLEKGYIKSLNLKTISKIVYESDQDRGNTVEEPYIKRINSLSITSLSPFLWPRMTFHSNRIRQKLKLIGISKLPAKDIIIADSLNQALLAINSKYSAECQGHALKFNPALSSAHTNFEEKESSARETISGLIKDLKTRNVNGEEYLKLYVQIIKEFRKISNPTEFGLTLEKFQSKDFKTKFPVIDLVLSIQTDNSYRYLLDHYLIPYIQKQKPLKRDCIVFEKVVNALATHKQIGDNILMELMDIVNGSLDSSDRKIKDTSASGKLLNAVAITVWRKCKYSPFCFQNQLVKDTLLNRFYHYIDSRLASLTGKLKHYIPVDSTGVKEGDGNLGDGLLPQTIISHTTALSNVKTVQSSLLLTRTFVKISKIFSGEGKGLQIEYLADILVTILRGLSTFPCSTLLMPNARSTLESFKYFVPNLNLEFSELGSESCAKDNLAIMSILNKALFSDDYNNLNHKHELTALLFKLLTRCDKSNLFFRHFVTHLIQNILLRDQNYVTFIHLYHMIGSDLIRYSKLAHPNRLFYRGILHNMFPYYLVAISRDGAVYNIEHKAFSDKIHYETSLINDRSGFPCKLTFSSYLLNQPMLGIELNSRNLASSIKKLTSFTSFFFGSAGDDKQDPFGNNEPKLYFTTKILADMIDLHAVQDPKESQSLLSHDSLLARTLNPDVPITIFGSQDKLTDLIFSDDSSETLDKLIDSQGYRQILNKNFVIQDLDGAYALPNGIVVYVNTVGVANVKASTKFDFSIFEKSYSNDLKIGIQYYAQTDVVINEGSELQTLNSFTHAYNSSFNLVIEGNLKTSPNIKNSAIIYLSKNNTQSRFTNTNDPESLTFTNNKGRNQICTILHPPKIMKPKFYLF